MSVRDGENKSALHCALYGWARACSSAENDARKNEFAEICKLLLDKNAEVSEELDKDILGTYDSFLREESDEIRGPLKRLSSSIVSAEDDDQDVENNKLTKKALK